MASRSLDSFQKNIWLFAAAAGAIIILFVVMVFTDTIGGDDSEDEVVSEEKVNLVMWGLWDESGIMNKYITQFQKQYPNVTISYRKQSSEAGYRDKLTRDMAVDRGPDIFSIHRSWVDAEKEIIQPMPAEVMSTREYKQRFLDPVESDFMKGSQIYGFPLYVDTLSLFYNRDAFNDAGILNPPKTWSEFQDITTQLTRLDQDGQIVRSGAALGTADNVNRAHDIVSILMMQQGADMVTGDSVTNTNSSQNAGNAEVNGLNFYTDFADPLKQVYTWSEQQPNSITAFAQGEAMMMFGYSHHIDRVRRENPRLNFDVAQLPQIAPADKNVINYADYWGYTVSHRSSKPKIAYEFLKFLTEKENLHEYHQRTRLPTPRRDLIGRYRDNLEYGVFAKQLLTARTWDTPPDKDLERIFDKMINDVNSGRATPSQAISEAKKRANISL